MSGRRYTDEFKIEAVQQGTDRGYPVREVAERLGVTTHSLYAWMKRFGPKQAKDQELDEAQRELHRLKAELRRVTEERDIPKRPPHTSPRSPGEVWLYPKPPTPI